MYLHNVCRLHVHLCASAHLCHRQLCSTCWGRATLPFTPPLILSRSPHLECPKGARHPLNKTDNTAAEHSRAFINKEIQKMRDTVYYYRAAFFPKIKGRGSWRRHLSLQSSVWPSGLSHDSQVLVEKPHWHPGSPQQHAGLASLEIAFNRPMSKRDARLKWGMENSVARQPTFAKAQATDVYLFKSGGEGEGGGTGLGYVWTKREDEGR